MAAVEVSISASRTTVKPSSATPPHLRLWKISMIDQLTPKHHVPFILFYSPNPSHPPAAIVAHLKLSLSNALTKFYPLAGRLHDPSSTVDCGDQGVDFFEAQVPGAVDLAGLLLLNPGPGLLRQLVPCAGACTAGCPGGALLAVQTTVFSCGGVSLGLCISHKIADGVSFLSFLQSWAAAATIGGGDAVLETSFFPPLEFFVPVPDRSPTESTVQRRFVLYGPQLTALRSADELDGGTHSPAPTRVEVVTGLFWRAIIRARHGVGAAGEGLAMHMVDLRKKMTAPVAETMLGNFSIPVMLSEEDGSWGSLALGLRRAVRELDDGEKMRAARGPRRLAFAVKSQKEMTRLPMRCAFSSWCRFPAYGVDFGWGKPAWVAFGGAIMKHSVVIVDRKDGDGVEAWVSLEEDEMERLVRDEELLSHVSLC